MLVQYHQIIFSGLDAKPFRCSYCPKEFGHLSSLESHIERLHTNESKHHCDACGRAFSSKSNLTAHRKIHTGNFKRNSIPFFTFSKINFKWKLCWKKNYSKITFSFRRTSFPMRSMSQEFPTESSLAKAWDYPQLCNPIPVPALW